MKRTEMIETLRMVVDKLKAETILDLLERAGMEPPRLSGDRAQAHMLVYYDSSLNMWDEDFDRDPKLVETYNRRMNRKLI